MLTESQKRFIRNNFREMSVKKIAQAIGVPSSEVVSEIQALKAGGSPSGAALETSAVTRSSWLSALLTSYAGGFVLVFAFALLMRVLYLVEMSSSPIFKEPILDALMYHDWANEILKGDWSGHGHPVFYLGPLYPYFLAVLYLVLGKSVMAVAIVQVVISSLTAALVYHLTRGVFGAAAGLIAGFLAGAYNMFIYFSNQLLMETLVAFLNVLLLVLLFSGVRRPHWLKWAAAGVALGLSAAARGNILLFLPLAVAAIAVTFGPKNRRRWVMPAVILTVSFFLTVLPISLHNVFIGGDAVLLTSNSGINLYVGNTMSSDGLYNKVPIYKGRMLGTSAKAQLAVFPEIAKNELKRDTIRPSEVSRFWRNKIIDEITSNMGGWIGLMGSKLRYYFNAYEVPNNHNYYFIQQYSSFLKWPLLTFGLLFPFGALGMVMSWGRFRENALLYAFAAAQIIGVVPFFVIDRYRLGIVPIMILFAAYGLVWLRGELVAGRRNQAGIGAIILVVGYVVAYQPVRKIDYLGNYFNLGNIQWVAGNKDEALRSYDQALAINDKWHSVYIQKGKLLLEMGRQDEAIDNLQVGLGLARGAGETASAREAEALLTRLGVSPTAAPPPTPAGGKPATIPTLPRIPDLR